MRYLILFITGVGLVQLGACFPDSDDATSVGYDWDYLVFTQMWPGSECLHRSSNDSRRNLLHHCVIPEDVKVWTIHGLWPNKYGRRGPNYCNDSWPFNDDDIKSIMSEMKLKWPNYFADEPSDSLWQHEWVKHGTCASSLPSLYGELRYFSKALRLIDRFDAFRLLSESGIEPSENRSYGIDDVQQSLTKKLGTKVNIECIREENKSYLDQIETCFDKTFKLIDCEDDNRVESSCGGGNVWYPKIDRR